MTDTLGLQLPDCSPAGPKGDTCLFPSPSPIRQGLCTIHKANKGHLKKTVQTYLGSRGDDADNMHCQGRIEPNLKGN
ncbi:hypothetical protein AAFF_G00096310 [Aldrovandia affinis]|uniref:Uncharacterized protein n=1 Tax=Aldrovandia affinis TaxID=143900 RepID=A0AAD7RVT5_9TELE|nr:hypothetical protein AAFF_G00096310 [Aldrovandia affinis]